MKGEEWAAKEFIKNIKNRRSKENP